MRALETDRFPIVRCLRIGSYIWREPNMFSDRALKGKKILITGGGTGIGKSLGTRFLDLGAEIVICGRREEVLKGTVAEWTKSGGKASYVVCDVRQPDKVETMFNEIWRD